MKLILSLLSAGLIGAGLSFAAPEDGKACKKGACKKGDQEISNPFTPVVDDEEKGPGAKEGKRPGGPEGRRPRGERPDPAERAAKFMALDTDKSGGVSMTELAKGERFSKAPEEMRTKMFTRMDADKSGEITAEELKAMGSRRGPPGGGKPGAGKGGERPEKGGDRPARPRVE